MKKILLSALAVCTMILSAHAQASFSDGDTGFLADFTGTDPTYGSCLAGFAPNSGGYYYTGGNIATNNGVVNNGGKYLEFVASTGTLDGSVVPGYFDFMTSQSGTCNSMAHDDHISIDLSGTNGGKVRIVAKSDVDGATFRFWLASSQGSFPSSSTYAGASIIKDITLTTSWATYDIDLNDALNASSWTAFSGKNAVDEFGITVTTSGATYQIQSIAVGDQAVVAGTSAAILPASVKFYPNPATSVINVDNMNVSSLKLMNVNGTVVKESPTSSISVEGLTSGMYFLQINNYKPVKVAVK